MHLFPSHGVSIAPVMLFTKHSEGVGRGAHCKCLPVGQALDMRVCRKSIGRFLHLGKFQKKKAKKTQKNDEKKR
jgi:hypothetical protein